MPIKRNVIYLKITYCNNLVDRSSVNNEIKFLLELNKLLEGNKEFSLHDEFATPTITKSSPNKYGCNIHLRFYTKGIGGRYVNYEKLYQLLTDIKSLCNEYNNKFERLEYHIDASSMATPWVKLTYTKGLIVREGAKFFKDSVEVDPGWGKDARDELFVIGEPRAVRDFRRAWEFYNESRRFKYTPMDTRIYNLSAEFKNIKWHQLSVWRNLPLRSWHPVLFSGDIIKNPEPGFIDFLGNVKLTKIDDLIKSA